MNGLLIGDASVTGAHITLEDGTSGLDESGYNQYFSETAVLYFSNVSDLTIDEMSTWASFTPARSGTDQARAISINNTASNRNVTVKNCNLQHRRAGGWIAAAGGIIPSKITTSGTRATAMTMRVSAWPGSPPAPSPAV